MATRVCSKCKKELDVSCFYKRNDRKRGYASWCKNCCKQYNKSNVPNKIEISSKICSGCKRKLNISCFHKRSNRKGGYVSKCKDCCKQYNKDNASRKAIYNKQYNKDNATEISKQKKWRRETYPELIAEQKSRHYRKHIEQISKKDKRYKNANAFFETHFEQLAQFEETRRCPENPKILEVKCAYCGRWMFPTNSQVQNRLQVFNGITHGENRFYCSENCKQSCPIFNQKLWPRGFKKATSREVVPLLRQLVLERDNYTCQKCGATTETAQLHVHHEKSYTLNKIMANDPDNCITLCKECHKWAHSQEGCTYNDLKC
jgi:5-methylcytosine-specific restriction endonuclease McrA